MQEATLPITGMTCANCALTVERTLRKTAGVSEASVNFASERATVRFDPDAVSIPELVAAVERDHPGVVIEVHDGGQPHYPLLVVAE